MSHEAKRIQLDRLAIPAGSFWARVPLLGAAIGVIGIGASFALRGSHPEQFYFSWLASFMFFLSLALGGLFFVLLHFVTKAGWGVVVRRLAETLSGTLPLFVLLFIPVALGLHELYHWSHAEAVAEDHLLQGKTWWLNSGRFLSFAAGYLLLWCLMAWFYRRDSIRQDATGDHAITRRLTLFSGPCVIVFALTLSLAAVDWMMTLDPHWYSTIYGVYYFAGSLVGVFALLILLATSLSRAGYLRDVVTVEHFHDLGKLLFAFSVFWAYIGFSQFFLIWYGNIPEETAWYLHRFEGSWLPLTILLAVGHFGVPFFFLMPRTIKRRTALLVTGALWMLAMHALDIYWLVLPTLHHEGAHLSLLDLTTFAGIGGLFLAAIGIGLRRHALVPVGDPRLVESITFENV